MRSSYVKQRCKSNEIQNENLECKKVLEIIMYTSKNIPRK